LILAVAFAHAQDSSYSYKRSYDVGQSLVYKLTTDTYNNGKFASKSVAVANDLIVDRHRIPYEKITFTGFKESTVRGRSALTTMEDVARRVQQFYISLDHAGGIAIPKPDVPQMTGPITDFITYWVTLSSKIGADTLHVVDAKATAQKPLTGIWSDGKAIPVGRDQTVATVELVALGIKTARFRTSFVAPSTAAFQMAHAFMTKPIVRGAPNSFEQIQSIGNGKFNAMWGNESFVVTVTVDRTSDAWPDG